jgi:hypothetical protein
LVSVDGGHAVFVVALAAGRSEVLQPPKLLVTAELDAVGGGAFPDPGNRLAPAIGARGGSVGPAPWGAGAVPDMAARSDERVNTEVTAQDNQPIRDRECVGRSS